MAVQPVGIRQVMPGCRLDPQPLIAARPHRRGWHDEGCGHAFSQPQRLFVKLQGLFGTAFRRFPLRLYYKIEMSIIAERVVAAFLQPILVFLQDTQKLRPCPSGSQSPCLQYLANGQGIQKNCGSATL